MAANEPDNESARSSIETSHKLPETSPTPDTPPIKSDINTKGSKETPPTGVLKPSDSSSTVADIINIPSYSRWFSWNNIHECEVRFLPGFFDSRSPSKNSKTYKYYRNSIISKFRENPNRKITFTEVRKIIVGDVGSVRRVFDFLEAWGLINYSGSPLKQPLKWEEKESKSSGLSSQSGGDQTGSPLDSSLRNRESIKKLCSGCKSVCSIACFTCDKVDLTLCARCYVRGNYRAGVSSTDFRRVEISEEVKTEWTDRETLQLLEAIMHYGEDWKKVADHVGGRSAKECVSRFIKLPFGEQFLGPLDSGEVDSKSLETNNQADDELESKSIANLSSPAKRMRLSPLADASNPIMAQAAFLSALVGVEVAEAAARAAVAALPEVDGKASLSNDTKLPGNTSALEGAVLDAEAQLEKEELDVERAISGITEVQMKEIQDKIVHFEEFEYQMEKEWEQLQQLKNLLFVDQLTLLFHKNQQGKN